MTEDKGGSQNSPDSSGALSPKENKGIEANDSDHIDEQLEEADPRQHELLEQVRSVIYQEIRAVNYKGPIPPPQVLKKYDEVIPGLSERIIDAWQIQSQHRQTVEREVLSRREGRKDRSQHHALIIALVGLGLAAAVAAIDANPWVAIIFAVVSVGGPASALMISRFLGGRSS